MAVVYADRRALRGSAVTPFLRNSCAAPSIPNAVEQCTSLYLAQRQVFLTKNLLVSGTTAIPGGSELDILVNSWTRAFAVLTRTKNYIIFFEILSHFCIRDI